MRIPRIVKVFRIQNFKMIVKYLTWGSTRAQIISSQVTLENNYQIFILVLMTFITVYFIGILFQFAAKLTNQEFGLNNAHSFESYVHPDLENLNILALLTYYAMTTLAKIGYGDFYPISEPEKVYTLGVLLFSIVFFSFLLDRFIDILQNSPSGDSILQTVDLVSEKINLYTWLNQLTRYRENKPLPESFKQKLFEFFTYFYETNRNLVLFEEQGHLNSLPRYLSKAIINGYVYDDLLTNFSKFFRPDLYMDSGLFEELCRGLRPKFIHGQTQSEEGRDRALIFKEGEEVQEMIFVMKGEVGIGYTYFQNNAVN